MKKFLVCAFIYIVSSISMMAGPKEWHDNKFSMFIHFGVYSELGGVWNNKPVTYGYSEQIQAHAGIYSDSYEDVAYRFNPEKFNADEIVSLAKEAGMRSIVITSKHHDGFCLFKTETTDFNMFDMTPAHRDIIKELSDACRRGGISMGLYFSIIDWHMPEAAPITTHNATFVTEAHHRYNMAQVKELVTNYGTISELWFDMGSNTPQQSKDLYELVHHYQPDCMVSGRLGNGYYDFAVMGDNYYPDETIHTEWQSCASMFDETWGYRSWQKRSSVQEKADEKLKSLIRVVSNGGNYLLNIGPMGTGEVVPFERDVLQEIGRWTHRNADALYGVEASPFYQNFPWGHVTRKKNKLYLILTGKKPVDNSISLPLKGYTVKKTSGPVAQVKKKGEQILVNLTQNAFDNGINVIELEFDRPIQPQINNISGRTPTYSYCNWDYYTNYRSTICYNWIIRHDRLSLTYTSQEIGKDIEFKVGEESHVARLNDANRKDIAGTDNLKWGSIYFCGPARGEFDGPLTISCDSTKTPDRRLKWKKLEVDKQIIPSRPFSTYYVMQNVYSPGEQDVIIDFASGNGMELYLNGISQFKHLNDYRCTYREEKALLHLKPGNNQILLRIYNRYEKMACFMLRPSKEQVLLQQTVHVPMKISPSGTRLKVRQCNLQTPHSDTELQNLQIDCPD